MPRTKSTATKSTKVFKANKQSASESTKEKTAGSGRKKGFKKQFIQIKDPSMSPFYIVCEDRQYVKMQTGSAISQGYYSTLAGAVRAVAKDLLLTKKAGSSLTLSQFITEYEQLQSKILSTIKL